MSAITNPKPQTRDFFELVKAIGECKSKQEEDRIVADEVQFLKKAVPQPGLNKRKMKELVIRMLYVEMLGNDASFAYIKAVELCASTSIAQKRTGYLAAALCLAPEHEFRFMLVNMIQRDLKSTNLLEICAALAAVNKIVTEDMIPAVINDVLSLLKHEQDLVRKKAVSALHRLYQMDKQSLIDHLPKLRAALCDKDPSVMSATLPLFLAMATDDSSGRFKDLVPSFVVILKQITEHRLPREFDYHRIPAPWIQMNLLKVLAVLGRGDQAASEGMYEVLVDVMKRADTGINIGYAIVYEVVTTVTKIYPNTLLLEAAATSISRFIRSESHNLKYIGIKGLAAIVKDHPKYAADHQMAVIDCLEDPDETLKRKTLDLLYRMTNGVNVEFIVEKLLSFLSSAADDYFRSELVLQISQCAERFAPSNAWYVQTVIRVFELAGDKVKPTVAHTLTQLIAEGTEEDDDDEDGEGATVSKDDELRAEAVENFLDLMSRPKLPETLSQSIAWVMGEYGYLSHSRSKQQIMQQLADMAESNSSASSRAQLITAIIKLVAQNGSCPSSILSLVERHAMSSQSSLEVQQRCREFLQLLRHPEVLVDVLPVDASCEDIDVDQRLSFLNGFVQQALNTGAKPYSPPQQFDDDDSTAVAAVGKHAALKLTPYESPKMPAAAANANALSSISSSSAAVNGVATTAAVAAVVGTGPTPLGPALVNAQAVNQNIASSQGNNLISARGVNQVWGKKPEPPPQQQQQQQQQQQPQQQSAAAATVSPSNSSNAAAAAGDVLFSQPQPSAAATTATTATAAVVEAPRELTEKEKMAAALFGGVSRTSGSSSKSNNTSRRRTSAATSTTTATDAAAAVSTPTTFIATDAATPATSTGAVDLMGISNNSSNSSNSDGFNLLDMMDVMNAPPPTAAVQPPLMPTPTTSYTALPAAATATAATSPVAATTAVAAPLSVSDAFSDMTLLTATPTALGSPQQQQQQQQLQPLSMSTAEFGSRWGGARFEIRSSVNCAPLTGPKSLQQLRVAMSAAAFCHVESIPATQEAIFAATITTTATAATAAAAGGGFVLVHCKLNAARGCCDLLVKANSNEVAAQQSRNLVASLTAFRSN